MQPHTIGIGSRRLEVLKHKGRRKPSMLIFSYIIEIESLIYLNIGLKIDLISIFWKDCFTTIFFLRKGHWWGNTARNPDSRGEGRKWICWSRKRSTFWRDGGNIWLRLWLKFSDLDSQSESDFWMLNTCISVWIKNKIKTCQLFSQGWLNIKILNRLTTFSSCQPWLSS